MAQDFTAFLKAVSGMESSFGADPRMAGNPYGMTAAAGTSDPLALATTNFGALTKTLGRVPNDFEQYLAWQQGATGASKLLTADPGARAADVVPIENLKGNIGKSSGLDPATMTVGDFTGYIGKKWSHVGGETSAGADLSMSGTAVSGGVGDWIAEYFMRATLIILGFIFVLSGLRGFTQGSEEPVIRYQEVPAAGPKPLPSERAAADEEALEVAELARAERKAKREFLGAGGTPYGMIPKPAAPRAPRRTKEEVLADAKERIRLHEAKKALKDKTITVRKKRT